MDWKRTALVRALTMAAALTLAACGKGEAADSASTRADAAAPKTVATDERPDEAPKPTAEAPVESDPRDPVAVALPETELQLGDEPDDAPHVDRALRMLAPREGDQVLGRGFVLEGVPEDYAVYWPKGGDGENTYVIYDAVGDHVATLVESPSDAGGSPRFDPASVVWAPLSTFVVWPSELAPGQQKRGGGRTARFAGPRFGYRVDRLVALPWLLEGFAYRVDP